LRLEPERTCSRSAATLLQARAKAKTGDAVAALLNLAPKTGLLLEEPLPAQGTTDASISVDADAADGSSDAAQHAGKPAAAAAAGVTAAGGLLAAAKVREVPLELVQVHGVCCYRASDEGFQVCSAAMLHTTCKLEANCI
jgi:hypothetical protein